MLYGPHEFIVSLRKREQSIWLWNSQGIRPLPLCSSLIVTARGRRQHTCGILTVMVGLAAYDIPKPQSAVPSSLGSTTR